MRISALIPTVVAAIVFGLSLAKADVTFDVAVDVATLSADVEALRVICYTCEGSCGTTLPEDRNISQIDKGFNAHIFSPGQARTFKGTMTVVARTIRPGNATDYVCYIALRKAGGGEDWDYPPVSRQPWAKPKAGTPITAAIKGKL